MKSTFSTIFYLKRQAVKNDGAVPVMGRITVDGTQSNYLEIPDSCPFIIILPFSITL